MSRRRRGIDWSVVTMRHAVAVIHPFQMLTRCRPSLTWAAGALLAACAVSAVALTSGCSAPTVVTSDDVFAARQRLIGDAFCSEVADVSRSGVIPPTSPEARLVEHSIGCGPRREEPAILLSQFRSTADRDKACAAMRTDDNVLCGTGLKLWLMRVGADANIDRIEATFGDDVVRAHAGT